VAQVASDQARTSGSLRAIFDAGRVLCRTLSAFLRGADARLRVGAPGEQLQRAAERIVRVGAELAAKLAFKLLVELVNQPGDLEGSPGRHDEFGPPVRRIRLPCDVTELLELVDELTHCRLSNRRAFGEGCRACARLVQIREDGAVLGTNRSMSCGVESFSQTPGRVLIRKQEERWRIGAAAHVDIVARPPYDIVTILYGGRP